jgi:tricorn protease-like protein
VSDAEISPDGRWIAYESNDSGRYEVNVRSYPAVDSGRWQVTSDGGMHPLWSRDGGELFFIAADGMMMSARIEPGLTFSHARPIPLFPASQYHVNVARNYDVSPDGKRFLMVKNAQSATTRPAMVIVTRWFDELRAKLATTN